MLAMLGAPATGSLAALAQDTTENGSVLATVTAEIPDESQMTKGPKVEGIISARSGNRVQVTTADGARTLFYVTENTRVKGSGGFLGLGNSKLASNALLNGLPVTVETMQWDGGMVAKVGYDATCKPGDRKEGYDKALPPPEAYERMRAVLARHYPEMLA